MGIKSVDVPRAEADQGYWEQLRQSTDQARTTAAEYDVHVQIGNAGRIVALLTFSLGNGTTADVRVYKVPTAANRFKTWVLSRAPVWLFQRLGAADTGNVKVRVGSSLGANDVMTDQTAVAATTATLIGGHSLASRGSSMLVANGYEGAFDPATEIWMRSSTTGAVTQGSALISLHAYWEPL